VFTELFKSIPSKRLSYENRLDKLTTPSVFSAFSVPSVIQTINMSLS